MNGIARELGKELGLDCKVNVTAWDNFYGNYL